MGQGQPRHRLRPVRGTRLLSHLDQFRGTRSPGAVPTGDPTEAPDREVLRDRRGGRLLQGVRVGHQAREVDAACVDVAGPQRACRPSRTLDVKGDRGLSLDAFRPTQRVPDSVTQADVRDPWFTQDSISAARRSSWSCRDLIVYASTSSSAEPVSVRSRRGQSLRRVVLLRAGLGST